MQLNEEKNIISLLIQGDESAFEQVYRAYFQRVVNFVNTYLNDISVSKNITQDTFLKLWEQRKLLRTDASILSFLLVIARNSCMDYLKHQQVVQKYENNVQQKHKELELSYHALRRLEIDFLTYQEIEQIIQQTLDSLPPQCRQVFCMSRFEEKSNKEIADNLQLSVKTVEAHITRALKILREALKDYITILILLNIPLK
ncbi:MAG: RNA polymerase sigma-70 factor [Bacteroidales bacterium]|nr:RNA polymerase sigma-70 factor [Bacteroidales bacterium]